MTLRNAGLIKARPGKNGGYILAKDPSKISIRQIMDAFDNGTKSSHRQIKVKRGSDAVVDSVRKMHSMVMESLNSYLDCITVKDLLDAVETDSSVNELIAVSLESESSRLRSKK